MNQSEQINSLVEALAKAQGAIQNAEMDKSNPYFKSRYATLASVRNAINKPLSDNGLAATQTLEIRDTKLVLLTTIWHSSGQWLRSEYPVCTLEATPQEIGSALTYGRRYSLAAIVCNSSDEDDDGNAAQDATKARKPTPPAPSPIVSRSPQPPMEPYAIPVLPNVDGKSSNWTGWGQSFIAAAKASKTPQEADQWLQLNQSSLHQMLADNATLFSRLKSAVAGVYPKGVLLDNDTPLSAG